MTAVAEECPCGALRLVPPHSPATVARPPKRRFIECPTCHRFAVDYEMIPSDEAEIEMAGRFQRDYYIDPKMSAKTYGEVEPAKLRLDQPWNATCVSLIEEALVSKAGVFDLGACAGAFLTLANRLALPVEHYVGYEPNGSYLDGARSIRTPFPTRLHRRSTYDILADDSVEYESTDINVALCLMTLSHVPPDHIPPVIKILSRTFDELLIQDYLGNLDGEAENLTIHLHPTENPAPNFPLFAHPYRRHLRDAGYRIVRQEATRPLYQAFNWGVIRAVRP